MNGQEDLTAFLREKEEEEDPLKTFLKEKDPLKAFLKEKTKPTVGEAAISAAKTMLGPVEAQAQAATGMVGFMADLFLKAGIGSQQIRAKIIKNIMGGKPIEALKEITPKRVLESIGEAAPITQPLIEKAVYQPRTKAGQQISKVVGYPFEKLDEYITTAGQFYYPDNKEAQEGFRWLMYTAGMVLGDRGWGMIKGRMKAGKMTSPKVVKDMVEKALGEKIEYLEPKKGMPHVGEPVSAEAIARAKVVDTFLYDTRSKTARPVIGVEAVDVMPNPFEVKLTRHKTTGKVQLLDIGEKASFTPEMLETVKGKLPEVFVKSEIAVTLQRHAIEVMATKRVKSVKLVGSMAKKGVGKDIDILYDFGNIGLPKQEGMATEFLIRYIERNNIPIGDTPYDTFIKADGRYFHKSWGAGPAIIENPQYAMAQRGKPVEILASIEVPVKPPEVKATSQFKKVGEKLNEIQDNIFIESEPRFAFKEAIEARRGKLSEAVLKTEYDMIWATKKLSKAEKEALPYLREGITDIEILTKNKQSHLAKHIENPSKRLQEALPKVSELQDRLWNFMKEHADIFDAKHYVENHVSHIWEIPKGPPKSELISYFRTNNPFLKRRSFQSLEAGLEFGLKPKTTDITKIMRMEYKYAYETLANREFVDMLRSGFDDAGNRLLYTRADLAKLGEKVDITEYVELVNGIFGREKIAYAHPEIASDLRYILKEAKVAEGIPGKIGKAYDTVNSFLKHTQLAISMFHPIALTESALGFMSLPRAIGTHFRAFYRAVVKKHSILYDVKKFPIAKEAARMNVKVSPSPDYMVTTVEKALRAIEAKGGVAKIGVAVPKAIYEGFNRYLWDNLLNMYKIYAYEKLSVRSVKLLRKETMKKFKREPYPYEINTMKKEAGGMVNDAFGSQHWDLFRVLRNKEMQKWLQRVLLAPDWCVDRKTRAMTKVGWKYYDELDVSDEIMSFDPDTQEMKWSPLTDKYVNENYDGKIIKIKNWYRSIIMTPEHTCYVKNTTKGFLIKKASQLNTNDCMLRCGKFNATTIETFSDYFIRLVGWIVTDGYVKTCKQRLKDGTPKEYRYGKITQSKPKTVEILKELGLIYHIDRHNADHDKFKSNYFKYVFTIPKDMFQLMEREEVSGGLNWEFLSKLTKKQLQILYDTMMLGDGTGQNRFCGREKEVFFMTLIQTMLGLPTTFWQQEENCWRTRWLTKDYISCWGHHNNKEEIDYSGTIWCPSIDTGFWLAEREGLMFITGNTFSVVRQATLPMRGAYKRIKGMKTLAKADATGDAGLSAAGFMEATKGKFLGKAGTHYWGRVIAYNSILLQALNLALTKKITGKASFTWENEPNDRFPYNMVKVFIGKGKVGKNLKGGKNIYARAGKQYTEFIRYFADPLLTFGAKSAPLMRAGYKQITGKEVFSDWDTEISRDKSWETRLEVLVGDFLPFSLKAVYSGRGRPPLLTAWPVSVGSSDHAISVDFEKAFVKHGWREKDTEKKGQERATKLAELLETITSQAEYNGIDWLPLFRIAQSRYFSKTEEGNWRHLKEAKQQLLEIDSVEGKIDHIDTLKSTGTLTEGQAQSLVRELEQRQVAIPLYQQMKQEQGFFERVMSDKKQEADFVYRRMRRAYTRVRVEMGLLLRDGKNEQAMIKAREWNTNFMSDYLAKMTEATDRPVGEIQSAKLYRNYLFTDDKLRQLYRNAIMKKTYPTLLERED